VFDIQDIQCALEQLKIGKAYGFDGMSKEHMVYGQKPRRTNP